MANPTILIPVEQDSALEMDIYDSRLVASSHPRFTFGYEEHVQVYNWKTGRLLAVRTNPFTPVH